MTDNAKCATGPYSVCPKDENGNDIERRAARFPWMPLLAAIALLAGFIVWMQALERRITTVENGLIREHDLNTQLGSNHLRYEDQTGQRLERIEEKLDRLMERRR